MSTRTAPPPEGTKSRRVLIGKLEDQAKRAVTIHTDPTPQNIAKCHPQPESYLFRLPQELRDIIYELASTPYPDPRHRYKETALYYRPGSTARNRTPTALLHTCRRVWLEANHVPLSLTQHPFWFPHGPADTHPDEYWGINVRVERARYARLLTRDLTPRSLAHVTHVHCCMQMVQAESLRDGDDFDAFFPPAAVAHGFRPRVFRVTVRHVDWWEWEKGAPLRLDVRWVRRFLNAPALRHAAEFWLELEVPEKTIEQLDPIVERLLGLEGEPLLLDEAAGGPEASRFVRTDDVDEYLWSRHPHVDDRPRWCFARDEPLQLHVVTLKWRCERFAFDADDPVLAALLAAARDRARMQWEMDGLMRRTNEVNHRKGVWWVSGYPGLHLMMWYAHVRVARGTEDGMRERFERAVGDMVVGDVEREWEGNGSLLRFEDA